MAYDYTITIGADASGIVPEILKQYGIAVKQIDSKGDLVVGARLDTSQVINALNAIQKKNNKVQMQVEVSKRSLSKVTKEISGAVQDATKITFKEAVPKSRAKPAKIQPAKMTDIDPRFLSKAELNATLDAIKTLEEIHQYIEKHTLTNLRGKKLDTLKRNIEKSYGIKDSLTTSDKKVVEKYYESINNYRSSKGLPNYIFVGTPSAPKSETGNGEVIKAIKESSKQASSDSSKVVNAVKEAAKKSTKEAKSANRSGASTQAPVEKTRGRQKTQSQATSTINKAKKDFLEWAEEQYTTPISRAKFSKKVSDFSIYQTVMEAYSDMNQLGEMISDGTKLTSNQLSHLQKLQRNALMSAAQGYLSLLTNGVIASIDFTADGAYPIDVSMINEFDDIIQTKLLSDVNENLRNQVGKAAKLALKYKEGFNIEASIDDLYQSMEDIFANITGIGSLGKYIQDKSTYKSVTKAINGLYDTISSSYLLLKSRGIKDEEMKYGGGKQFVITEESLSGFTAYYKKNKKRLDADYAALVQGQPTVKAGEDTTKKNIERKKVIDKNEKWSKEVVASVEKASKKATQEAKVTQTVVRKTGESGKVSGKATATTATRQYDPAITDLNRFVANGGSEKQVREYLTKLTAQEVKKIGKDLGIGHILSTKKQENVDIIARNVYTNAKHGTGALSERGGWPADYQKKYAIYTQKGEVNPEDFLIGGEEAISKYHEYMGYVQQITDFAKDLKNNKSIKASGAERLLESSAEHYMTQAAFYAYRAKSKGVDIDSQITAEMQKQLFDRFQSDELLGANSPFKYVAKVLDMYAPAKTPKETKKAVETVVNNAVKSVVKSTDKAKEATAPAQVTTTLTKDSDIKELEKLYKAGTLKDSLSAVKNIFTLKSLGAKTGLYVPDAKDKKADVIDTIVKQMQKREKKEIDAAKAKEKKQDTKPVVTKPVETKAKEKKETTPAPTPAALTKETPLKELESLYKSGALKESLSAIKNVFTLKALGRNTGLYEPSPTDKKDQVIEKILTQIEANVSGKKPSVTAKETKKEKQQEKVQEKSTKKVTTANNKLEESASGAAKATKELKGAVEQAVVTQKKENEQKQEAVATKPLTKESSIDELKELYKAGTLRESLYAVRNVMTLKALGRNTGLYEQSATDKKAEVIDKIMAGMEATLTGKPTVVTKEPEKKQQVTAEKAAVANIELKESAEKAAAKVGELAETVGQVVAVQKQEVTDAHKLMSTNGKLTAKDFETPFKIEPKESKSTVKINRNTDPFDYIRNGGSGLALFSAFENSVISVSKQKKLYKQLRPDDDKMPSGTNLSYILGMYIESAIADEILSADKKSEELMNKFISFKVDESKFTDNIEDNIRGIIETTEMIKELKGFIDSVDTRVLNGKMVKLQSSYSYMAAQRGGYYSKLVTLGGADFLDEDAKTIIKDSRKIMDSRNKTLFRLQMAENKYLKEHESDTKQVSESSQAVVSANQELTANTEQASAVVDKTSEKMEELLQKGSTALTPNDFVVDAQTALARFREFGEKANEITSFIDEIQNNPNANVDAAQLEKLNNLKSIYQQYAYLYSDLSSRLGNEDAVFEYMNTFGIQGEGYNIPNEDEILETIENQISAANSKTQSIGEQTAEVVAEAVAETVTVVEETVKENAKIEARKLAKDTPFDTIKELFEAGALEESLKMTPYATLKSMSSNAGLGTYARNAKTTEVVQGILDAVKTRIETGVAVVPEKPSQVEKQQEKVAVTAEKAAESTSKLEDKADKASAAVNQLATVSTKAAKEVSDAEEEIVEDADAYISEEDKGKSNLQLAKDRFKELRGLNPPKMQKDPELEKKALEYATKVNGYLEKASATTDEKAIEELTQNAVMEYVKARKSGLTDEYLIGKKEEGLIPFLDWAKLIPLIKEVKNPATDFEKATTDALHQFKQEVAEQQRIEEANREEYLEIGKNTSVEELNKAYSSGKLYDYLSETNLFTLKALYTNLGLGKLDAKTKKDEAVEKLYDAVEKGITTSEKQIAAVENQTKATEEQTKVEEKQTAVEEKKEEKVAPKVVKELTKSESAGQKKDVTPITSKTTLEDLKTLYLQGTLEDTLKTSNIVTMKWRYNKLGLGDYLPKEPFGGIVQKIMDAVKQEVENPKLTTAIENNTEAQKTAVEETKKQTNAVETNTQTVEQKPAEPKAGAEAAALTLTKNTPLQTLQELYASDPKQLETVLKGTNPLTLKALAKSTQLGQFTRTAKRDEVVAGMLDTLQKKTGASQEKAAESTGKLGDNADKAAVAVGNLANSAEKVTEQAKAPAITKLDKYSSIQTLMDLYKSGNLEASLGAVRNVRTLAALASNLGLAEGEIQKTSKRPEVVQAITKAVGETIQGLKNGTITKRGIRYGEGALTYSLEEVVAKAIDEAMDFGEPEEKEDDSAVYENLLKKMNLTPGNALQDISSANKKKSTTPKERETYSFITTDGKIRTFTDISDEYDRYNMEQGERISEVRKEVRNLEKKQGERQEEGLYYAHGTSLLKLSTELQDAYKEIVETKSTLGGDRAKDMIAPMEDMADNLIRFNRVFNNIPYFNQEEYPSIYEKNFPETAERYAHKYFYALRKMGASDEYFRSNIGLTNEQIESYNSGIADLKTLKSFRDWTKSADKLISTHIPELIDSYNIENTGDIIDKIIEYNDLMTNDLYTLTEEQFAQYETKMSLYYAKLRELGTTDEELKELGFIQTDIDRMKYTMKENAKFNTIYSRRLHELAPTKANWLLQGEPVEAPKPEYQNATVKMWGNMFDSINEIFALTNGRGEYILPGIEQYQSITDPTEVLRKIAQIDEFLNTADDIGDDVYNGLIAEQALYTARLKGLGYDSEEDINDIVTQNKEFEGINFSRILEIANKSAEGFAQGFSEVNSTFTSMYNSLSKVTSEARQAEIERRNARIETAMAEQKRIEQSTYEQQRASMLGEYWTRKEGEARQELSERLNTITLKEILGQDHGWFKEAEMRLGKEEVPAMIEYLQNRNSLEKSLSKINQSTPSVSYIADNLNSQIKQLPQKYLSLEELYGKKYVAENIRLNNGVNVLPTGIEPINLRDYNKIFTDFSRFVDFIDVFAGRNGKDEYWNTNFAKPGSGNQGNTDANKAQGNNTRAIEENTDAINQQNRQSSESKKEGQQGGTTSGGTSGGTEQTTGGTGSSGTTGSSGKKRERVYEGTVEDTTTGEEKKSSGGGKKKDDNEAISNSELNSYIKNVKTLFESAEKMQQDPTSGFAQLQNAMARAAIQETAAKLMDRFQTVGYDNLTPLEQAALQSNSLLERDAVYSTIRGNGKYNQYIQNKDRLAQMMAQENAPDALQAFRAVYDEYNSAIESMFSDSTYAQFKNMTEEGQKEFKQNSAQYIRDVSQAFGEAIVNPYYRAVDDSRVSKTTSQFASWISKNGKVSSVYGDDVRMIYEHLGSAQSVGEYQDAMDEINNLRTVAIQEGNTGMSFTQELGQTVKNIAKYFMGYASVQRMIGTIKQGIAEVKNLDSAYMELRQVSSESGSTIKAYQKESFGMADAVGTSAVQIQKSTADWLRLGKSFDEAKEYATLSTKLLNVSEFTSIDSATSALVSATQAYQDVDASDIVDKLNYVGNNFAVGTQELAEGLANAGGVLVSQGNSIDETLALLTAG